MKFSNERSKCFLSHCVTIEGPRDQCVSSYHSTIIQTYDKLLQLWKRRNRFSICRLFLPPSPAMMNTLKRGIDYIHVFPHGRLVLPEVGIWIARYIELALQCIEHMVVFCSPLRRNSKTRLHHYETKYRHFLSRFDVYNRILIVSQSFHVRITSVEKSSIIGITRASHH